MQQFYQGMERVYWKKKYMDRIPVFEKIYNCAAPKKKEALES